jgi:colanic acid/amylovoran biosynthesis glycosyltransferase
MKILHLISTFPPLTETFVLREIRQLRKVGLDVIIGPLRPLHRTPPAIGFEDLNSLVRGAGWFSVDMLKALLFFSLRKPHQLVECLKIALRSLDHPQHFAKMLYVLLSSMRLAYCSRNEGIEFVRADFLHTQALAARFLKSLLGVPYGITVYTVVGHYKRTVLEEIVNGAAVLIADTLQTREFLLSIGAPQDRVHLIRNGVSMDEFPMRYGQSADSPPIILAAGSLIPKKGFHVLLSACAVLRERGTPFRCVLIGDGCERARLGSQKKALGLDDCVEMLGYLSLAELREWYYRATLFVMPSVISPTGETDGLPTVIIEALACGLPVIGTHTAGIPEVIQHGVNGILVPADAPKPLADGIQMLLDRPDLRQKFGTEGRRLVERDFCLERKVEALCDLFVGDLMSTTVRPRVGESIADTAQWSRIR